MSLNKKKTSKEPKKITKASYVHSTHALDWFGLVWFGFMAYQPLYVI